MGAWAVALALAVLTAACEYRETLKSGSVLELSLEPGESRHFKLAVESGEVVHVRVDQQGLDVELQVPGHLVIDSHHGRWIPEQLWWLAETGTTFHLTLKALGGDGNARLEINTAKQANAPERRQVERFWTARDAMAELAEGNARAAESQLEAVLHDSHAARSTAASGARLWRARILDSLGRAQRQLGDSQAALSSYDKAIDLLTSDSSSARQPALESRLLEIRSSLLQNQGRLSEAELDAKTAINLAIRGHDKSGQARATNRAALVDDLQGELSSAIEGFSKASKIYQQVHQTYNHTNARLNLARALMNLGSMTRAKNLLEEIQVCLEKAPQYQADFQWNVLQGLGWWHYLEQQPKKAHQLLEASLALQPDHSGTLDRLATTHVALGDFETARDLYTRSTAEQDDRLYDRSRVNSNLCRLELRAGNLDLALELCRTAYAAFEDSGARGSAAHALYLIGSIQRQAGQLEAAEAALVRSIETTEIQRQGHDQPELRSLFLAERLESYQLLIQVRMELHSQSPGDGWDQRALETFELTRARQLRDFLAAEGDVFKELLPPPQPIQVEDIRGLLDTKTSLAFFHVGEEASFLWLLRSEGLKSYRLAPKAQLEPLVQAWYSLLSDAGQSGPWNHEHERQRSKALSRMLFADAADDLKTERLVFIADDVLQRLPFGALQSPTDEQRMLISDHEILGLPSASVLSLIRRNIDGRELAPGLIALVADPVYHKSDERLDPRARQRPQNDTSAVLRASSNYARLHHSAAEAQTILTLLPEGDRLLLDGFRATTQRVLSGDLARYQIVHFATHAETRRSSGKPYGLVLTQITADGQTLNGVVGLKDLYGLKLPAELAVLSACGTGLGEDLEGEGLMSLTRGFMNAGTPRVVTSLWSVQDRAARQLMARFYQGLARRCLSPPEALRQAQLSMWREGRPKHQWAPFQIQGDWRPFLLCTDGAEENISNLSASR